MMTKVLFPLVLVGMTVSGCAKLQTLFPPKAPDIAQSAGEMLPPPEEVVAQPLAPPPPPTATRVADFDTTTPQDRAEALAVVPAPASETLLGATLASLGSPTDPGIWIKTGLVSEITAGRIDYQGQSINIELRPSGGPADGGSQISLPAMRLLNAPLTAIIEVKVYALPATQT